MRGVAGCADGDDGGDLGDACGGGEDGGAADGVPDQQLGSAPTLPEEVGGGHQVLDRRAERCVGGLPRGLARSGEVEAEHGDAPVGQAAGDPGGGGPSWPQVKQCANNATAVGSPSGRSSHPASGIPAAEPNVTRCRLVIGVSSPTLSPAPVRARYSGNPAGFVRIPIKVEASADRTGLSDAESRPASPSWMSGKAGSGTRHPGPSARHARHFAGGRTHRR